MSRSIYFLFVISFAQTINFAGFLWSFEQTIYISFFSLDIYANDLYSYMRNNFVKLWQCIQYMSESTLSNMFLF